jgi:hypothetical protein
MRRNFEERLTQFGEVAKQKQQAESPDEAKGFDTYLTSTFKRLAERRGSTPEAQRMIFEYQEQKQQIMAELRQRLAAIGTPEEHINKQKETRRITFQHGRLNWRGPKGNQAVDEGSLFTDAAWGIDYQLDPKTVPKHLRKKYLVERAKYKLRELLDWQILTDELSSSYTDNGKQYAYEQLAITKDSDQERPGHIAEKMVRTFLEKLAINHELDFEVLPADVYQDVQHKIDFIIKRKSRVRGVGIEESDEHSKVGIQFTINSTTQTLLHKQEQIRRALHGAKQEEAVEDILLVRIPLNDVRTKYLEWQKAGSPPGGPEALWDSKTQEQIFKGVMHQFLAPHEVDAWWLACAQKRTKAAA